MARKDYLPTTEAALVTWTDRFLTAIQTAPADYGLVPLQASDYAVTRTRFIDLYLQAQSDSTRTRVIVNEKNVAKKTLINATRMLVRVCEAWPQMTNAKRLELGITEKKPRPAPIPPPTTEPYLKVVSVVGRRVTIDLQSSKTKQDKPAGVDSANVFVAYGDVAPTDELAYALYTGTNRSRVELVLGDTNDAVKAWVTACWLNRRRESGPACAPVAVPLAAIEPVPNVTKLRKVA
ncbi:MAG: hypothetical protein QM770_13990 [Tepidisphaeraceae bacterium]